MKQDVIISRPEIYNKRIFANRNFKKGEEITADYSNDGMVSFECNCGSKKCEVTVS